MEKKKSIVLGMAIAAVFLIAAVGSASAFGCEVPLNDPSGLQGTVYGCGATVRANCTFTGPLGPCPCGAPGLEIGANNIVIDGAGWTMTGSKGTACCNGASETNPAVHSGISSRGGAGYVSYDNVVIKNLVITEFCTGIALGWGAVQNMDNITVTGCTIHDNGVSTADTHGLHMCYTNDCNITRNDIYDNDGTGVPGGCSGGGNGIFMYGDVSLQRGRYNEITWNNLYDNNKSGYFMKHMCMYNTISNNTANGNVQGGITLRCMMSDFNNVTDNNISWNDGWGLEIGGHNNTIKRNRITNNTDQGIYLDRDSSDYNKIVDNNTIWDNNVGIKISTNADYNEISNNIQCICYNPHNDIENNNPTTFGDYNTCDTTCGTVGYCDNSVCPGPPYCFYQCPGSGPDYYVTEKSETWVADGYYNVTFTVTNIGNENATNVSNTLVKIEDNSAGIVHNLKYSTPPLNATVYTGSNSFTKTIGLFNAASAPHKITVCADIDGNVIEPGRGGEDNNCTENMFGAPDLEISYFWWDEYGAVTPYGAGDGNVNDLWKTYYLVYRVKNVGDVAAAQFWMNLSCLDTSAVPVCTTNDGPVTALDVGAETPNRVVGPFVVGCDNARPNADWSQVCADCNDAITENYEHVPGQVQPQWDRCMPTYTGCCDDCGDVNCVNGVDMGDYLDLYDHLSLVPPPLLTCNWAGDVNCVNGMDMGDYLDLYDHLSLVPPPPLDCC